MVGKMYDVVDILIQRMHVYKFIVNDYLKSFTQIILDESETMILLSFDSVHFLISNWLKKKERNYFRCRTFNFARRSKLLKRLEITGRSAS